MTLSPLQSAAALLVTASLAACAPSTPATPPAQEPAAMTAAPQTVAAPLAVETYNPGANGIFEVSSTLITGAHDAVLVNAQFSTVDAAKLVAMIQASGKTLTTIYISHGDPDFYFGLETLTAAFPDAKVLATPTTIAYMQKTAAGKLAFWSPKLGAGAPKTIVMPTPVTGNTLTLEGQSIEIVGLDAPTPDRTVLWIPSIKTVVGGIPVFAGEHVWMADTQSPQSHADWIAMLDRLAALQPTAVIPGHFDPGAPQGVAALTFTADYIRAFDAETAKATDGNALIAAMKQRYPTLKGVASLELSAKVAKGEMQWP